MTSATEGASIQTASVWAAAAEAVRTQDASSAANFGVILNPPNRRQPRTTWMGLRSALDRAARRGRRTDPQPFQRLAGDDGERAKALFGEDVQRDLQGRHGCRPLAAVLARDVHPGLLEAGHVQPAQGPSHP